MVGCKTKTLSPLQQRLIKGLEVLPDDISLCLLNGKKVPQGKDWQNRPYNKAEVAQAIAQGIELENSSGKKYCFYPQGYGLMAGYPISVNGEKRYLLVLDQDGSSAKRLIEEMSGGDITPTVRTTSGRNDRCHRIYYVGEEYALHLHTKKIATGELGEDGKPEHVEFLWSGRQAVLPPSVHPTTGCYQYLDCSAFDSSAIAHAPTWVIEKMLRETQQTPLPNTQSQKKENWTDIDWALSYLNALSSYRADDYDDWLAVGMALQSVDDSLLTDWDNWSRQSSKYKSGDCEKKWKSFKSQGVAIGTLAHMAKQDGWRSPFTDKTTGRSFTGVTGDSRIDGDSRNVDLLSVAATVTSVTEVLKSGFPDWMEISKIEAIRVKSELSYKPAFYALVSGIRNQFDEVQPDDEVRLKTLIDWHNAKLDFNQALPSMAADILHDAAVLNIDPIGIWQYLLPAVLSLAGKRVNLSLGSHDIPAIVWTAIIAESGTGKTRAEKLITSPLKQLQSLARKRFEAELEEWEETVANWKKEDGKKPPKPVERKYLFDVATIQAVMRRQSEQGMNGSLWARDELVGIFQSFGQFNKGDNEALSCLATSWDGGSSQVDRVNQEDSYIIESSRLSIAGGLQPGMFKKAFKDPNDSQGLQARFLFAAMKPKKPKRVKGFCHLSEKLPAMYQWLDNLPEGEIKLSIKADRYYDKIYEAIGEQAFDTSMPAIRAWMFKLPSQLLRIALGLHLIECYHDQSRSLWTLQKDTLERAVLFAQYYRSTFHIVQTTAVDTADISAILLQIWDKALTRHPEGISTRDAYREIKNIQYLAKEANRAVAPYTADLFGKLAEMGKGTVVKKGRLIKFVANLTPPPITPQDDGGVKPEPPPGDTVTVTETIDIYTSGVSPINEVSLVTLQNGVVIDVLQNEVHSGGEKALVGSTDLSNTSVVDEQILEEECTEVAIAQTPEVFAASEVKKVSPITEGSLAIGIGDRVIWENCPACCEDLSPFEIMSIDGQYAKLDLFEKPVLLKDLRRG
jgi:hypothetical protein